METQQSFLSMQGSSIMSLLLCQTWKKLENLSHLEAFDTLITFYAQTSNLPGVNRMWKSLKSTFPRPKNIGYLVMLLAVYKQGDLESLEKYSRVWESDCLIYDVRVSNVTLESYLKRDLMEEADLVYESMVKSGLNPI